MPRNNINYSFVNFNDHRRKNTSHNVGSGIRKRARQELIRRDGKRCYFCSNKEKLQVDHVIPLKCGGTWDVSNLNLLCEKCHVKKSTLYDELISKYGQRLVEHVLLNMDTLITEEPVVVVRP